MKRQKVKIIYQDETVFTKRTIASHTYSTKGSNIMMFDKGLGCKPTTVLAAVSQERGVEHVSIQKRQINSRDFIEFVKVLIS